VLGGRSFGLVAREVTQPGNYRALVNMARRYPRFRHNVGRYFLGRGSYPYRCEVRTPRGVVAPTLFTTDDMWTVNEIFCREDYRAGPDLGFVVDVGSNIGISALYFLTRNATSRVHLYEPVPANVGRLRANLAGLEDRYVLQEAAVADSAGPVSFGVEPTGRYGGIGVPTKETLTVDCLAINDVLESALEETDRIDVLKVDTEGMEVRTVSAIRPDLLERIGVIYFETEARVELFPDVFETRYESMTATLRRPQSDA
jgi:FkbM family methyltransferase